MKILMYICKNEEVRHQLQTIKHWRPTRLQILAILFFAANAILQNQTCHHTRRITPKRVIIWRCLIIWGLTF